jgi:hypothetical protein
VIVGAIWPDNMDLGAETAWELESTGPSMARELGSLGPDILEKLGPETKIALGLESTGPRWPRTLDL